MDDGWTDFRRSLNYPVLVAGAVVHVTGRVIESLLTHLLYEPPEQRTRK